MCAWKPMMAASESLRVTRNRSNFGRIPRHEMGKGISAFEAHQDGDKVEMTARVTGHWGFKFGQNSAGVHIEVSMLAEADCK